MGKPFEILNFRDTYLARRFLASLHGLVLEHFASRCRYLPFFPFAWFLKVLVPAKVGKDARLFTFLFESLESAFKRLTLLDSNSCHSVHHP